MKMKKYYYETQTSNSPRTIMATTDENAIESVRNKEGGLDRIVTIYEEEDNNMREIYS